MQSHAELGGILLAHETYSLVKGTVLTEEGDTITAKGFTRPLRTYKVVGLHDDLAEQGITIRSPSSRGVAEEAPGAYKNVSDVVLSSERAGLARRVARLKPVICIKG